MPQYEISIYLSHNQLETIVAMAIAMGMKPRNRNKGWTEDDKKRAVERYIKQSLPTHVPVDHETKKNPISRRRYVS